MTIGVLMRIEQFTVKAPLFEPATYNAFFTVHGVIMIFMFVLPGLPSVFGNFFLPILIGARDVAFPRLNLLSWYFFVAGALLAVVSLFTGQRPARHGMDVLCALQPEDRDQCHRWRSSPPSSSGFSSILTGIEFHHHDPPAARARHELAPACRCSSGRCMQPPGFRCWRPRSSASPCCW